LEISPAFGNRHPRDTRHRRKQGGLDKDPDRKANDKFRAAEIMTSNPTIAVATVRFMMGMSL
jgi:hypothetical protein